MPIILFSLFHVGDSFQSWGKVLDMLNSQFQT